MTLIKGVQMPNPKEFKNEEEFMNVCIPMRHKEHPGEDNEQSIAICMSMWSDRDKPKDKKMIDALLSARQVLKMNTRHDAKGRFASKAGGAAAKKGISSSEKAYKSTTNTDKNEDTHHKQAEDFNRKAAALNKGTDHEYIHTALANHHSAMRASITAWNNSDFAKRDSSKYTHEAAHSEHSTAYDAHKANAAALKKWKKLFEKHGYGAHFANVSRRAGNMVSYHKDWAAHHLNLAMND